MLILQHMADRSVQFYIHIVSARKSLVEYEEAQDENAADDKSIQVERCREYEQKKTHELQRIAELKI